MSDPNELFDVVDDQDNVVGQATRGEVHARGLLHRAVHIFVFNDAGELLVQKRSASKDESPLKLTSSASGHVDSGETYETAAHRELREELGITADLEFLWKAPASPETANEHMVLYRTVSTADLTPDPHEIVWVRFQTLGEIRKLLTDTPDEFSPPYRVLLNWYFENTH